MSYIRSQVLVCDGGDEPEAASRNTMVATVLRSRLEDAGLGEEIQVIEAGNLGLYSQGSIVIVHPENIYYENVTAGDVEEIVEEHLLKGRPVARLLLRDLTEQAEKIIRSLSETAFYQKQTRIVLRNSGIIDPENVEEYIAVGGYEALGRALTEQTPEEVRAAIQASGLKTRNGAPIPVGDCLRQLSAGTDGKRCVCCNAGESSPSPELDRTLLEGDPFAILEALTLAGYAAGAQKGCIRLRPEETVCLERLTHAVEQATEYGLLGENLFDSGFSFKVELRTDAPACDSREVWRTNAETLANLPWILSNGAKAFAALGMDGASGTRVIALEGAVARPCLAEVTMGTTLRELICEIGCGSQPLNEIRWSGYTQGALPADAIDQPIGSAQLRGVCKLTVQ